MLKTVKNAMSTTEDLAKRFGSSTGDLAKRVGSSTGDLAKRVGSGTVDLAKQIGPKRAIIGAIVIGSVVAGSIVLVRYLRSRKEQVPYEGSEDVAQNRSHKRNKRGTDAHLQH
jgi:hypothetical protein